MSKIVEIKAQKDEGRKITILGMGPTANERRIDIEKYCEGTEIWGLNNGYLTFPHLRGKWSRYFELHKYEYLKTWKSGARCHFTELNRLDCEIWRTETLPVIEKQRRYDIVEICRHFETNYFLGSPSLMLMLAIYEHDQGDKISEIRSWGIDTSDPQHAQQRHSWAFWLSMAHQRDINLNGTSTAFFAEPEKDEGLQGLREYVGRSLMQMQKKTGPTKDKEERADPATPDEIPPKQIKIEERKAS